MTVNPNAFAAQVTPLYVGAALLILATILAVHALPNLTDAERTKERRTAGLLAVAGSLLYAGLLPAPAACLVLGAIAGWRAGAGSRLRRAEATSAVGGRDRQRQLLWVEGAGLAAAALTLAVQLPLVVPMLLVITVVFLGAPLLPRGPEPDDEPAMTKGTS